MWVVVSGSMAVAQSHSVTITGRVIDQSGQPISNARVSVFSPYCDQCTEFLIVTDLTRPDGAFKYSEASSKDPYLVVFAEVDPPEGYWDPLAKNAVTNMSRFKEYRAATIEKAGATDLGNIPLSITYEKISLKLSDVLKTADPRSVDLNSLRITGKVKGTSAFLQTQVPASAIKNDSIDIALPRGKWELNFNFRVGKKKHKTAIAVNADGTEIIT